VASNVTEPVLGQLRVNDTLNTTAIQNQLGVTKHKARNTDHQSRGIFNLKSSNNRSLDNFLYGPSSYWSAFHWCVDVPNSYDKSLFLVGCVGTTGDINGYELESLHPVFNSLFINTLRSTGELVLAIEAVQTLLYASAYYQTMFAFDMEAQATMQLFTPVLVPTRWRGLIMVGSFVALHLVLLTSTIWLYVGSQSFRGQSNSNVNYEALQKGRKHIGGGAGRI
jgi:hypothetical protein